MTYDNETKTITFNNGDTIETIHVGLFLDDDEQSVETVSCSDKAGFGINVCCPVGSNGTPKIDGLSKSQAIEIADFMVQRWQEFRAKITRS